MLLAGYWVAAVLWAAAFATTPPDVVEEPLGSDDAALAFDATLVADDGECDAIGDCALNAVQKEARKIERDVADLSEEIIANDTYNMSGGYDAACFNNVGADGCTAGGSGKGKCTCETGCMGADGNCYAKKNKLVAKDFLVTNMKWPKQKMYVQSFSVFGQMKTTSFSSTWNRGADKFNLYELPGKFNGQKEYFLSSAKWPGYVTSIGATAGTSFSLWGTYSIGLKTNHEPWELKDVMLRICSLRERGHPDAVMIGTSVPTGGSTIWSYIKDGTYFIYGWWYPEKIVLQKVGEKVSSSTAKSPSKSPSPEIKDNYPGEGGYWTPDPPLPKNILPAC